MVYPNNVASSYDDRELSITFTGQQNFKSPGFFDDQSTETERYWNLIR
jgi:hypothetical protein